MTTLRSLPCGRGGAAAGSSPAAIRSVQSAYIANARCRPTCVNRALIPRASLSGLNPPIPGGDGCRERAERCGDLARRLVAQLMAAGAAVGVDDIADPLALALDVRRNAVASGACAGKIALRRQLKQRQPILRRVVLRRGLRVGRGHRLEIQCLAWRALDLR